VGAASLPFLQLIVAQRPGPMRDSYWPSDMLLLDSIVSTLEVSEQVNGVFPACPSQSKILQHVLIASWTLMVGVEESIIVLMMVMRVL
jgi:hypothetical protein